MSDERKRRIGMRTCWSLLVVVGLLSWGSVAVADDAGEIVRAALEQNSTGFQTGVGRMTVVTESKGGDRKRRVLEFKGKSSDDGRRTRVKLTAPDEVKGQSFLFVEVRDGEDRVHWYLPAFGVTRRIAGGKKKGSFIGTHFTYADLESRDIREATYTSLKDDKIGSHDVYVVEARPKKGVDSDYSRIVLYVRKSDKMLLKARFYGQDKKEAKVLFIEKIDTSAGKRYVKQMTLRPADGGYTRLTIESIDLGAEIADAEFTPEALAN